MKMTFYGAVREVTGSMHLLTTQNDRILLDCGMYQGRRKEVAEKNRRLPFDSKDVTNAILSHAHIDHSGRLPFLVKNGFHGRILCTRVTADACKYLLPDSAHIQESDADYLNYKTVRSELRKRWSSGGGKKRKKKVSPEKILKRNGHRLDGAKIKKFLDEFRLEGVEPLYTAADAEDALDLMDSRPYRHPTVVGKDTECTLYEAGHILGSAITVVKAQENGQVRTVCYTGDIGRFDKPILRDPARQFKEEHRHIDLLIMESTYGDRTHEPIVDLKPALKKILSDTQERNGTVIIPAFAYGRTQELLYMLHELYNDGEVSPVPIYVDSPLATNITRVFGEHPEVYDSETHEVFLEKGRNPFFFDQLHFVGSVEESMALNREEKPHIVIAASGMCEAGRVLHHLRHKIHSSKHTILIVGFMAQHTLGRRILDQGTAYAKASRKGDPPIVKILNKEYPLKAHVTKMGGFSAHGDRNEMLRFLKTSNLNIKRIALVHGEENQSIAFAQHLEKEGYSVVVPHEGESIDV